MRTFLLPMLMGSLLLSACQPARSEPSPRAFIATIGLEGSVRCGANGQDQWGDIGFLAGQTPVQGLSVDQIRTLYGQAILATATPGFEDPARPHKSQHPCDIGAMRDDWRLVPVPSGKSYQSRIQAEVGALRTKPKRLEHVRVWPGLQSGWHGNKARLTLSADQGSGPLLDVEAIAHYEPYARQAQPKTVALAPFSLQPRERKQLEWPRFINDAGEAVLDPNVGDYALAFIYVVNPKANEGGELYLEVKLPPHPRAIP